MTYADLPEEEKEKRRASHRRWAAANDRSAYYAEYERKRTRNAVTVMWNNSNNSAKRKGFEHNIDRSDIVIPDICPCCMQTIDRPSLDRVDNSRGYVKGNVQVICTRCNLIKRDGDADIHRKVADYIDRFS